MHPGGGGGAILVLNVADKPSVAKSVAEILSRPSGGMRSREGRSWYNRVFEFDYATGGRACYMLVTSVTGHLMELEFDDRFRRWHSCDPADLFNAPVRKVVPQFFPTTLTLDSGVTRPPPLQAKLTSLAVWIKQELALMQPCMIT